MEAFSESYRGCHLLNQIAGFQMDSWAVFHLRMNLRICKHLNFPVPKNRKTPWAGGVRVRRASAGRRENLGVPGPFGPGQAEGYNPGA